MNEIDILDSSETPEIERAIALAGAMRSEIAKVVVGQDEVIEQILVAFLAGGHVLLEGVPGVGKTLLVLALAKTFGGDFSRVQFTPDLMPTDVTGHTMFHQGKGEFEIRKGPAFTHLLLADEINRAPAKTQAALLEVMQEQQVTIEGEPLPLSHPFMTLATQNPIEQEGTYPLPEAQLDRFLLKVFIDYPSQEEEIDLVQAVTDRKLGDSLDVEDVQEVADVPGVLAIQQATSQIIVDESIVAYAVEITRATRSGQGIAVGAGPRGSIALIRAARARAVLNGRGYVVPDDVKEVALCALRHRVALTPDVEIEGLRVDDVLHSLMQRVEAPRT